MKQLHIITQPTFDLPDYTPEGLDYMEQAHIDEMYAFVHLFRQQCPLFGLPVTYALNSFYLKRQPHGKIYSKQYEKGKLRHFPCDLYSPQTMTAYNLKPP